jgi:hypothetical protein
MLGRGGETGRRTGLKILGPERVVRVRFSPPAPAFARFRRASARQAPPSLAFGELRRGKLRVRAPRFGEASSAFARSLMRITLPALVVSFSLAMPGCGSSPSSPSASPRPQNAATFQKTTLSFTSDPQDFVGQGRSRTWDLQTSVFQPIVARSGGYLSVVVRPNGELLPWVLIVVSLFGRTLAPGSYDTRDTETSGLVALTFSGDGRGCGNGTGHIVIHEVVFGPDATTLLHFRATFEQHCQGASSALRGEIAVLADPWR